MPKSLFFATTLLATAASGAFAADIEARLKDLAVNQLSTWLQDDGILNAIREQNNAHAGLSQSDIDALDQQWRAEVDAAGGPLIAGVLSRDTSRYLAERRQSSEGLVTEVFVMDNLGLNVAQSDPTSDYWQGDEDKFQKTFSMGSGSIHIGEVELDESTGSYQVQISMAIDDPASGETIGAATFGVTME